MGYQGFRELRVWQEAKEPERNKSSLFWIPAFAGMTGNTADSHSREGGNPCCFTKQRSYSFPAPKSLAVDVYRLTASGGLSKDYGLKDQTQRVAVSMACNISEGCERKSDAELVRFHYICKGSLCEIITQLEIVKEVNIIPEDIYLSLEDRCSRLGAMLTKLIQARKDPQ